MHWTCDQEVSEFDSRSRRGCSTTLGKMFTHLTPVTKQHKFGANYRAVTVCGWEGNTGLAIRFRLHWFIHLPALDRGKRQKDPAYAPAWSMASFTFTLGLLFQNRTYGGDKSSAVAEMGDRGHNRHGPKRAGAAAPFAGAGAGSPYKTRWPGPMSTSVLSGVLIHPADWPQETWAENCVGSVPFFLRELGLHVTQSRLGRGLPPYQVAS